MNKDNKKIIVIVGQTAVGKSDFAVSLAKKINAEIISADSRQVYAGAELMSGAITKSETKGIHHHLISYIDIKKQYSVSDFLKDAKKSIKNISERDKNIIICGGTAMYVDALVYKQVFPKVKPNKALRKELSTLSAEELYKKLKKLDKKRAETIDKNNPHRLIRAIEIAKSLGSVPEIIKKNNPNALIIGLKRPDDELKERIRLRIQKRMRKGMLREAQNLLDKKVKKSRLSELGLEFNAMLKILENKSLKNIVLERLYFDVWHFAKRQMTWWKRNKDIVWLSPDDIEEAVNLSNDFLNQKNA